MTTVSLQDNYRYWNMHNRNSKGNRRYLREQWELSKINARHQITGQGTQNIE